MTLGSGVAVRIVVVTGKAEPYRKECGEAAGIRRRLLS